MTSRSRSNSTPQPYIEDILSIDMAKLIKEEMKMQDVQFDGYTQTNIHSAELIVINKKEAMILRKLQENHFEFRIEGILYDCFGEEIIE